MRLRRYDWSAMDPAARRMALLRPAIMQNPDLDRQVRAIVATVRTGGDSALLRLTRELDRAELTDLRVTGEEVRAAESALPAEARAAIETAIANVRRFHAAQATPSLRVETAPGVVCERISKPLQFFLIIL